MTVLNGMYSNLCLCECRHKQYYKKGAHWREKSVAKKESVLVVSFNSCKLE